MKTNCPVIIFFALILGLVACASSASQIKFAIAQTQTAAPYPTQVAYPTQTPYSTPTSYPTPTVYPTETAVPKVASAVGAITWSNLIDFLLNDHTNWNSWTPEYTCVNFSIDLAKNAKSAGINAWIVAVVFINQPEGHTFVGFTTDRGIIWVEPQSDETYVVSEVGQPLCLANNPNMCWDKGIITQIIQPADCDPVSHECWQE